MDLDNYPIDNDSAPFYPVDEAEQQQQQNQNTRKAQFEEVTNASQGFPVIVQEMAPQHPRYQPTRLPQIFNIDGRSLAFYISPNEPHRGEYLNKIIQHGGILVESPTDALITLGTDQAIRLDFIDKCIEEGRVVIGDPFANDVGDAAGEQTADFLDEVSGMIDPVIQQLGRDVSDIEASAQLLSQQHQPQPEVARDALLISQSSRNKPKTPNRFTEEQDEFVLERVREKPRLRNSHKFYDALAEHPKLAPHTGNSIRSRYRRVLRHRLYFVYKTDDHDRLVFDSHGQKINIGIDEIGGTLKNKFTAEDDYRLCLALKNSNKIVYSVFSDLYRRYPNHSINSWRDRYRKFVKEDEIDDYINYYLRKKRQGREPLCLSNNTKKQETGGGSNDAQPQASDNAAGELNDNSEPDDDAEE
ncbi:DNA-binding protein RAP1 [Candida viswanathii]|uniref:DNA-binding protein RAP1 n=1 Tax=Candida viswanathii TaxID=5486 RepID=A0A367XNN2_9ASCO|nr:DNA-binding protein RAP1 [Candida viswanathii]